MAKTKHREIPLVLPGADPKDADEPQDCRICGAKPSTENQTVAQMKREKYVAEFKYADGSQGMGLDTDLCLECALHMWRAMKKHHPAFIAKVYAALMEYEPVASVVREWRDQNKTPPGTPVQ